MVQRGPTLSNPSTNSKRRILCTEDDADNRELLEFVLTHQGFEVVATGDPREVLNLAKTESFNLYILDVRMPHLSGIDLCKRLREFDPKTPILIYSAAAYEADKQLANECGAQSFLAKPVHPETLVAEVLRLTSE